MDDFDLVSAKQAIRNDFMRPRPEGLANWCKAKGSLSNAEIVPINVHAVGLAYKRKGRNRTNTLCVRVTVLRKMNDEELADFRAFKIPESINGIPTDVVEAGPLMLRPLDATTLTPGVSEATAKVRPLRPGCSIMFGDLSFGTLGAFCRSKRPGESDKRFLLSCRHVLAGFGPQAELADIFQPGGPRSTRQRGLIAGKATGMIDSNDRNAFPPVFEGDAAIAPLRSNIPTKSDNLGVGIPAGVLDLLQPNATSELSGLYCKFGRATGLTVGELDAVKQDIDVRFGDETVRFNDMFVVRRRDGQPTPMSDRGDSGAMVFRQATKQAVGLLVGAPLKLSEAGVQTEEHDPELSFFSPLQPILEKLQIDLILDP